MGPCLSKIAFSDLILDGFDQKITIPTSIRVRNHTFDQFLKILLNFDNFQKNVEKMFFQNRQKIVLNRSINQNLIFLYFCLLFFALFWSYYFPIKGSHDWLFKLSAQRTTHSHVEASVGGVAH